MPKIKTEVSLFLANAMIGCYLLHIDRTLMTP